MEELLKNDVLNFEPVQGEFDVAPIAEFIAGLGFSFQDETDPAMYLVCAEAAEREKFQERRRAARDGNFPFVLLLRVTPEAIDLDQAAGGPYLEFSRQFMTWLAAHFPCRVTNEFGADLTAALVA